MNICTFVGRIGKDAVTRFTQAGKPITGWSLAVDVGWGDNKQTLWLDCAMFGERGEKLAAYILKGDKLGVSGELSTREYEGKTYIKLDVREVELLAPKQQDRGSGASGNKGAPKRERPARAGEAPKDEIEDDQDDIPFISNRGIW